MPCRRRFDKRRRQGMLTLHRAGALKHCSAAEIRRNIGRNAIPARLNQMLQKRLIALLLLLILLPTFATGWMAYRFAIDNMRGNRLDAIGRVAESRREQLAMVLRRADKRADASWPKCWLNAWPAPGWTAIAPAAPSTISCTAKALPVPGYTLTIGPKRWRSAIRRCRLPIWPSSAAAKSPA